MSVSQVSTSQLTVEQVIAEFKDKLKDRCKEEPLNKCAYDHFSHYYSHIRTGTMASVYDLGDGRILKIAFHDYSNTKWLKRVLSGEYKSRFFPTIHHFEEHVCGHTEWTAVIMDKVKVQDQIYDEDLRIGNNIYKIFRKIKRAFGSSIYSLEGVVLNMGKGEGKCLVGYHPKFTRRVSRALRKYDRDLDRCSGVG